MSFAALGLLPTLVESLARLGITEPSPVQRVAVPPILSGRSVIAVARTGSGKTLAYGAPVLQRLRLVEDTEGPVTERARPRAVVLTGTRELVEQTMKALKGAAHGPKLRVRAVAGGMTDRSTGQQLKEPVDVLVANPPRLRALLDRGLVRLDDVRVFVLDEGDTLCAPGQRGDVELLLRRAPPTCQLVLMSATLPEPIRHWATTLPQAPVLLLSKDAHAPPERVKVRNVRVRPSERADAANDALGELPEDARGILFTNRRETADACGAALAERGHAVVVVHGGMLPDERRAALARFRAGEGRVLVTTELGGRGLHLDGLAFVLNWELPEKPSEYLHRIGRVGRQGAKGLVYNLVTDADGAMLKEIERLAAGGRLDTGETLRAERARPKPEAPASPGGKTSGERGLGERPAARSTKARPGGARPGASPRKGEGPARSGPGGARPGAPPRRGEGAARKGPPAMGGPAKPGPKGGSGPKGRGGGRGR